MLIPSPAPALSLTLLFVGACTGTLGQGPQGFSGDSDPSPNGDGAAADTTLFGDTLPAGDPRATGDGAAGDSTSPADDATPLAASCAQISAAILASTGNTILVSSGAFGQVLVNGNPTTLRQVVAGASPGDTILLADGTYTFAEADPGDYTGLYFTTPGITLRGQSGDASAVILDSNYAVHGGMSAVITVAAADTVLADFTVQRSITHLIHFQTDADRGLVHQVALVDGGQQLLKASGTEIDGVEVSCSRFTMTSAGRDNVWGYGTTDGGTRCYTGGIDTHASRDWHVHDSFFSGIYCNAGGVQRPAHGKEAAARDYLTYTGGLAEHAIHMWDAAAGHGHVIERNRIVDCARGIGLGMAAEVYDTVIRNNTVSSSHAGSAEHDVGINVERAHDTDLVNNTVFFSSPSAYPNAIEYRFASTTNLRVQNNLTNQLVRERDGAAAGTVASNNVDDAQAAWFVDVSNGDLHLDGCGVAAVVGAGVVLGSVSDDFDGEPRSATNDIGADQCR
jgi:hypothetical protein